MTEEKDQKPDQDSMEAKATAEKTEDTTSAKGGTPSAAAKPEGSGGGLTASQIIGYAGGALIIAASIGWLNTSEKSMSARNEDASADQSASAGPSGPCKDWQEQLCEGAGGPQSSACGQAKGAAELLSDSACKTQLKDLPATLARIKAGRVDCDTLVTKLCTDLGPETDTCKMVTEKTPAFPPARCKEMLGNYDKVLGQLKNMKNKGPRPGRPGGPHGQRPNPHGPGGPPGALRKPAAPVSAVSSPKTGAVIPVAGKAAAPAKPAAAQAKPAAAQAKPAAAQAKPAAAKP